ncbi:MAG: VOC family protein [Edaphobacter sp.]
MQMDPYLFFNGNCEEAFKFYEQLFGGKIEAMMTHEGTPAEEHTPSEWRKKILHARMVVGDRVLMGSDAPPDHSEKPQGFSVSLQITDPAEAERIFNALSKSGTIGMPFQQTFWAYRFGMVVDRFGIPWMVNCEKAA